MKTIITYLTIFILSFVRTQGQTSIQTKTIALKPLAAKKTIRIREGDYLLYFDAINFLQTIAVDSSVKKLNKYFSTADTLFLTAQKEKDLNISVFNELNLFQKCAMVHGEATVFNWVTKKTETELLCLTTTSSNEIYTSDKGHLFCKTSVDITNCGTK